MNDKLKKTLLALYSSLPLLVAAPAALTLVGCEGGAEEVGEDIDDAVEDTGDAIEDATD